MFFAKSPKYDELFWSNLSSRHVADQRGNVSEVLITIRVMFLRDVVAFCGRSCKDVVACIVRVFKSSPPILCYYRQRLSSFLIGIYLEKDVAVSKMSSRIVDR